MGDFAPNHAWLRLAAAPSVRYFVLFLGQTVYL